MARVLKIAKVTAAGQERDFARAVVFEAPMRDEVVVLQHELADMQPRLLDGRTAKEYWGESVRAARGGHIPGALSLPAAELLPAADSGQDAVADYLARGNWVAYAHDAYEGLAYLTRLRAGQGAAVRLYLGGWAEWAADGALAADAVAYPAVSYPDASAVRPVDAKLVPAKAVSVPAILAMVLAAFAAGWWIQRRRNA
jgi:thiosulfate/3-mercaptopyruvate sulfurtransferase